MKTILPHQEYFVDDLKEKIKSGERLFVVKGTSGCGKTFSMDMLKDDFSESGMLPIYLNGDPILSTTEYYPFYNALSGILPENMNYNWGQVMIDCGDNIPSVGKSVASVVKILTKRNTSKKQIRDLPFNEKEQDIICKIQYLAEHRDIFFICNHLNYWDEKSIKLLYLLLVNIETRYHFLSQCIFVMLYDDNKEIINIKVLDGIKNLPAVVKIVFPKLEYDEFIMALHILGYSENLSDKEGHLLYSLVSGHIQMLIELISELKKSTIPLGSFSGKAKELLSELLKQRLEKCGATGEQIRITLEYAALLGVTFSVYELNSILQFNESSFRKIIEHSKDMNLTECVKDSTDSLQFAHDIIRELFEHQISENGEEYYRRISLCLKEIEPSQYLRRSQYALKSGNLEQSLVLFVLEVIKQIREDGDVSTNYIEKCRTLLEQSPRFSFLYDFILCMKKGYSLYRDGCFDNALNEVIVVGDIYPEELLAEREILCSYCYTKKIDSDYRTEGLERLMRFASIESCNNEPDIYERVLTRILILYVHLGEIGEARKVEEKIIYSLKNRLNHDETAQTRYHILNRISNSIYGCEISSNKMLKAVNYFGHDYKENGLWRNLKQYYLARVNYAGALCLNGSFYKSFEENQKLLELYQRFPEYTFPRPNILLNNYLVSGYLANQIETAECMDAFAKLIQMLPLCAERLFYTSNYSIFLALNGKIKEALSSMENEGKLHNADKDSEKIYNYRVILNTAVFKYLLGMQTDALDLLYTLKSKMDLSAQTGDEKYDYDRLNKIISFVVEESEPPTGHEWENIILLSGSNYQSTAWNYYGKGYVFTTVFNWDL